MKYLPKYNPLLLTIHPIEILGCTLVNDKNFSNFEMDLMSVSAFYDVYEGDKRLGKIGLVEKKTYLDASDTYWHFRYIESIPCFTAFENNESDLERVIRLLLQLDKNSYTVGDCWVVEHCSWKDRTYYVHYFSERIGWAKYDIGADIDVERLVRTVKERKFSDLYEEIVL